MLSQKTKSTDMLGHIRTLLNEGRAQDALNYTNHLGQKSQVLENARGVCLLRLGKIDEAVSVLREVVFQGYVCIPSDTPALFQANFATAMLMANYKDAAMAVINRLDDNQHPAVAKIKSAIAKWKKNLNFFERLLLGFGAYPKKPVAIDFPPGDI
ncbi:MAG TPA: hypothetical protein VMW16_04825 [Sedimentisphaerales bacterium]|nr:hypothetical protein [Sedimentisphaerales bacterium]